MRRSDGGRVDHASDLGGRVPLRFVFTLGSYLIASILGRHQHWTLSVFISDQASFNADVPFAAAMALFLTVLSLVVVGIVMLIETRTRSAILVSYG